MAMNKPLMVSTNEIVYLMIEYEILAVSFVLSCNLENNELGIVIRLKNQSEMPSLSTNYLFLGKFLINCRKT